MINITKAALLGCFGNCKILETADRYSNSMLFAIDTEMKKWYNMRIILLVRYEMRRLGDNTYETKYFVGIF